jgi:hypothetical protein
MAKAFYSQDEAKVALNTTEDGLKDFVREGRLTEYRDGQTLMYKGSQVEALVTEMAASDEVALSDTGGIGLVDSRAGGSGSAIGLADSANKASGGGVFAKDDTAGGFALSDSDAGPAPVQSSRSALSESGITIFGPDDDMADPMAQTQLGDTSGEQVNLEGIGSGSGLLDLTQEPDDTSFGAETFDEIMPGETGMGGTVAGMGDLEGGIDTAAVPAGARGIVVGYEPYDPSAPIFGGLAGGAAFAVLLGLLGVAAAAVGAGPGMLGMFYNDDGTVNTAIALAALLGLPVLGAIIGWIGGRVAT